MRTSSPVPQADAPTVRIAGPEDYPLLLSFLAGSELDHPPNDLPRDLAGTLRCPAARIFLAEMAGRLVGTVTASWNGRNAEFRCLFIPSDLRYLRPIPTIVDALFRAAFQYLNSVGMTRALAFVIGTSQADIKRKLRLYSRLFDAKRSVANPITISLPIPSTRSPYTSVRSAREKQRQQSKMQRKLPAAHIPAFAS